MQKVAFCIVKGRLLQSVRAGIVRLLTVSSWFIALYVKCRKMLFFMPNCVPMRADGILKGLNGF